MPKGGASSLTPVYAGLQEDLDAFLKAYMAMKSIRFTDYKKLFEHRGMVQLFNGRNNSAEIIEFNECLLVHCLQYLTKFICPGVTRCLKERLFGLYSLYTFYYIQQENHVVKIRMDPDASSHFRKLAELVLQEQILDAYMVCLKLIEDKAIKHVAFITIHDPANFKRFNTDDKVTGVSIQANLNDPMSNLKSLHQSREFLKLGLVHSEYLRRKERTGFDGCHLINIHQTVNEIIIQQSLKISMNYSGVDEIINTDYSSDQLASRGMLRLATKEQAYSADLKLARSRRHRSSTPLDVASDTFEFEDAGMCENKVKDIKRIKKELATESSKKRSGRRRMIQPEVTYAPSSPEEKLATKKCRLLDNEPIDSHSSQLSEVEHEEHSPADKKSNKFLLNFKNEKVTPKVEKEEFQPADETTSVKTTKSIMKSTKITGVKVKRHVSFRERHDGKLDNTVHEIPNESAQETGIIEKGKNIKKETEPVLSPPQSDAECHPYEERFDSTDMFKPLEVEEPDEMDDLSDDELMIIDDM